jgi:hypothetical protein
VKYNPIQVAHELREHLSSDKRRLGFFMGAGTSMAAGLPGIIKLTSIVESTIDKDLVSIFKAIQAEVAGSGNIELILNRIRLIRELLSDSESLTHNTAKGSEIKKLDSEVCKAIHQAVSNSSAKSHAAHDAFAGWVHSTYDRRDTPIELFTTNYDLMLEAALEGAMVPYFDGFIGSVNPFFSPESVDSDLANQDSSTRPPRSWTRLWKLHGSVNWTLQHDDKPIKYRVVRSGAPRPSEVGDDLMIFPSREKYLESRKLPFITFQDRFRRFASNGESAIFIMGYSFLDQHLNEILFQALRNNSRLAVNAFIFSPDGRLSKEIESYGLHHRNLSIFGQDKAVIGGVAGEWDDSVSLPPNCPYWKDNQFSLTDFNSFAEYLDVFIGMNKTSLTEMPKPLEAEVKS